MAELADLVDQLSEENLSILYSRLSNEGKLENFLEKIKAQERADDFRETAKDLPPQTDEPVAPRPPNGTIRATRPSDAVIPGTDIRTKELLKSGASGAMGAIGFLGGAGGGLPGALAGAEIMGGLGSAGVEAGSQLIDFITDKAAGRQPLTLSRDALIQSGKTGMLEGVLAPIAEGAGGQIGTLGKQLAKRAPGLGVSTVDKLTEARKDLAAALVGTAKRFHTRFRKGTVQAEDTGNAIIRLSERNWAPLENFTTAEQLFQDLSQELGAIPARTQKITGETAEELLDNSVTEIAEFVDIMPEMPDSTVGQRIGGLIDAAAEIEESKLDKLAFVELKKALGGEKKRLANKFKDATERKAITEKYDEVIKNLEQFNIDVDVRPRVDEIREKLLPDVQAKIARLRPKVQKESPGLLSDDFLKLSDAQQQEKNLIAELNALDSGEPVAFNVRDIQDFKVEAWAKVRDAFEQKEVDRSVIKKVYTSAGGVLNKFLDDRLSQVDKLTGSNFLAEVTDQQQLYADLKAFAPVANELRILEKTGKLSERIKKERTLGPIDVNPIGSAAVGSATAAAVTANPALIAAAAGGGASFASKRMPSRLQQIHKALAQIDKFSVSSRFPRAKATGRFIVRGSVINTAGRNITKLTSGESSPEEITDAVYLDILQTQGLVDDNGFPTAEFSEDLALLVEEKAQEVTTPLKEALQMGTKLDVLAATASLAKQNPGAFPKPKTGLHGEVRVDGKLFLPDFTDRAEYAEEIKQKNFKPVKTAKILGPLNKDGTVVE